MIAPRRLLLLLFESKPHKIGPLIVIASHRRRQSISSFTLIDEFGTHHADEILQTSRYLKRKIDDVSKSSKSRRRSLRVGVLCANNYTYLTSILATWMCRASAVTLNRSHPSSLLNFYINDSECDLLIRTQGVDFSPSRDVPQIEIDPARLYLQSRDKKLDNQCLEDEINRIKVCLNYLLFKN